MDFPSWAAPWDRLSARKSRAWAFDHWNGSIRSFVVSASGGARMQEGVLSLMQMAKVAAVLAQLAERRHTIYLDPHQSDDRRRERELCDAR